MWHGRFAPCRARGEDFSSLQKTKRKLEDAAQRLECLYEKLREQAVSVQTPPLPSCVPILGPLCKELCSLRGPLEISDL